MRGLAHSKWQAGKAASLEHLGVKTPLPRVGGPLARLESWMVIAEEDVAGAAFDQT